MMEPVQRALAEAMSPLRWSPVRVPMVSNASGRLVRTGDEVRRALIDQIASAVRWVDCVETLRREGVSTFVELGPGRVLGGLIRRIDRDAEVVAADSETGLRSVMKRWS
jgi:[acyl-carrier-protein] S-malonyltransferase